MTSIIIDTNLLVLLIVGKTNPNLIEKHKRTRIFQREDYNLLINILMNYDEIVVTPHILTETSNLISQTDESTGKALKKTLSGLLQSQREEFEPSVDLAKHHAYLKLGLTDSAIIKLTASDIPLITTDLKLYLEASKSNKNTINFNYLRQERLLSG